MMKKKLKMNQVLPKAKVREHKVKKEFSDSATKCDDKRTKKPNIHSEEKKWAINPKEKKWANNSSGPGPMRSDEVSSSKHKTVKLYTNKRLKLVEERHIKTPSNARNRKKSYKGIQETERKSISMISDTSESGESSMSSEPSDSDGDMVESARSDSSGMESDHAENNESDMESDSEQSDDQSGKQSEMKGQSECERDRAKRLDVDQGDSEHSEDDTEDHEMLEIKKELSNMPFEELQKLKEKLGLKAFNQAMSKKSRPSSVPRQFKRENKNRPREMSSKKPVSRFKPVFEVKKKVYRDPRFDDLSGDYNETLFHKSYSFLDDVKRKEKLQLERKLRKEKNPERRADLQYLVQRMNQQEKAAQDKLTRVEQDKEWKKKEREMVKQGKTPFYLKNSEKRKLELADKYRELKKSGKVEKYLMKKRKKNSTKERKKLPNHHKIFTD